MLDLLSWKYTYVFYGAIPLLIFFVTILWLYHKKKVATIKFLGSTVGKNNVWQHASLSRQRINLILLLLTCILLVFALARPYWKSTITDESVKAGDLVVALDISRSMLAQDVQPNRLECAKQKIRLLVRELATHRVALIVFSGSAFVQTPLTRDLGAFFSFLDAVDVETISSGSTNIVAALDTARELLKKIGTQTKLVFLATDGEDFKADTAHLFDTIQQDQLEIITYGVGTEQGAPIPLYNEHGKTIGYQKDKQDNIVITRKNAQFLKNLATKSHGIYVQSTSDNTDIAKIAHMLDKKLAYRETFEQLEVMLEKYHIFCWLALVGLLITWLL